MSKERVLQRLAKLQALANDPTGNTNETAAAAALMAEIMLRERIAEHEVAATLGQLTALEKILSQTVVNGRSFNWQKVILSTAAAANSCILLTAPSGLSIFGSESDLAQAVFLYQYLYLEITRLGTSVAFRQGAAMAVHSRLHQMRTQIEAEHSGSVGLVHVRKNEDRVREVLNEEVGPTRNKRLSITTSDQREHQRGYNAGQGLDLNPSKNRLVSGGAALPQGRF